MLHDPERSRRAPPLWSAAAGRRFAVLFALAPVDSVVRDDIVEESDYWNHDANADRRPQSDNSVFDSGKALLVPARDLGSM